jgi:hypothetical protein
VEGGIETGYLRKFGPDGPNCSDRRQIMGLVKRRKRDECLKAVESGGIYKHGPGEMLSPMNDAMADADETIWPDLRVDPVEKGGQEDAVIMLPRLVPIPFGQDMTFYVMHHHMGGCSDAFDQAVSGSHRLASGKHFRQGEFEAR